MKTDQQGCSTVQSGYEKWETFNHKGKKKVQYDYRSDTGKLFSCVANSLKEAISKKDKWVLKEIEKIGNGE